MKTKKYKINKRSLLSINIKNLYLRPKLKVKTIEELVNNDNLTLAHSGATRKKQKGLATTSSVTPVFSPIVIAQTLCNRWNVMIIAF